MEKNKKSLNLKSLMKKYPILSFNICCLVGIFCLLILLFTISLYSHTEKASEETSVIMEVLTIFFVLGILLAGICLMLSLLRNAGLV